MRTRFVDIIEGSGLGAPANRSNFSSSGIVFDRLDIAVGFFDGWVEYELGRTLGWLLVWPKRVGTPSMFFRPLGTFCHDFVRFWTKSFQHFSIRVERGGGSTRLEGWKVEKCEAVLEPRAMNAFHHHLESSA